MAIYVLNISRKFDDHALDWPNSVLAVRHNRLNPVLSGNFRINSDVEILLTNFFHDRLGFLNRVFSRFGRPSLIEQSCVFMILTEENS